MHTLNEQVEFFTADTAEENIESIKEWIAAKFGWVHEGSYIYLTEEKKLGIYFYMSGTTLRLSAKNKITTTTVTGNAASIDTSVTLRWHVSKGESVTYISINSKIGFLVAETTEGDPYIIVSGATDCRWEMLNESALEAIKGDAPGIINTGIHYAITKMPAIISGGEFKELFLIVSARYFSMENCSVNFENSTQRLVAVEGLKIIPQFAFPVGD